jgi:hypothetical protein
VEGGRGSPRVAMASKLISHNDRGDLTLTGISLFFDDPNTTYRGDLYRRRIPPTQSLSIRKLTR